MIDTMGKTVSPFLKALELHLAKKFHEAEELYTEIIKKEPLHVSALLNRAYIYDEWEMGIEARQDLDRAIALSPDYMDAFFNRGLLNNKEKKYEQAVKDFQKAISLKFSLYDAKDLVTLVNPGQAGKIQTVYGKLIRAGFYPIVRGGGENIIIMPSISDRIALYFNDLHISKTAKRRLKKHGTQYKLNFDGPDFGLVVDSIEKHYPDRIPLRYIYTLLNENAVSPRVVGVSLYRDGRLVAGELGITAGKVYISLTGYHDESSAGTVQIILLSQYLQGKGYVYTDFGLSTPEWDPYKKRLGARKVSAKNYFALFNKANPGADNILKRKTQRYPPLYFTRLINNEVGMEKYKEKY